jgi:hypothetical protein
MNWGKISDYFKKNSAVKLNAILLSIFHVRVGFFTLLMYNKFNLC